MITRSRVRGMRSSSTVTDRLIAKELATIPAPKAAAGPRIMFQPGDRVRHDHFGEGVVVSARDQRGDTEVTVAFEGQGVSVSCSTSRRSPMFLPNGPRIRPRRLRLSIRFSNTLELLVIARFEPLYRLPTVVTGPERGTHNPVDSRFHGNDGWGEVISGTPQTHRPRPRSGNPATPQIPVSRE